MSLASNVRYLRTRQGMTQAALAAQIRVKRRRPTASYISRVESGMIDPQWSTIRSIARALHVKPWQLVADLSDNTAFWDGYLLLSARHKREVQRLIEWHQR